MNTLYYKIGLWSSIILTISFVAWIVCFVGIAATSPLFIWTNLSDYLDFENANSQVFQNIAKIFMLIFGPVYFLFIMSIYGIAEEGKRDLVRISSLFALAFCILSSINYFVQLTAVRLNILNGTTAGLESFVQANPISIISAINMLAWTLFLGLSALFIFPIFRGSRLQNTIRKAFVALAFSCFTACLAYVFQIDLLTFISVNLGLGGAVLVISIASIKLWRQMIKNVPN